MPWTYYIDGYNVIHHSAILKPLADEDLEAARDALIEKVARFCTNTGSQTTVVFDGRGDSVEPAAPFGGASTLEVLYSAGGQSADALIEQLVYAAEDRRSIIVVTADRGIRDLCMALGALVMAPDKFLATAREAQDHVARNLERLRRANAPGPVQDRLDESARKRLRKLRGELSD